VFRQRKPNDRPAPALPPGSSVLILFCAVFILVGIGVASTINRALALKNGALFFDPIRATLPATELQDLEKYDRGFGTHPVLTFLHIIPGSLFLILAPFQFSSRIRNRHIRFHRWSGRLIIVIAVLAGLFGLFLGVPFQFTGTTASSAGILFGVLFLIALVRAFIAIRRHDLQRHREWMIRAFSIGIGISTVRIVGGILFLITRAVSFEMLGLSFWIGWTLTLAAGELWIRRNRTEVEQLRQ